MSALTESVEAFAEVIKTIEGEQADAKQKAEDDNAEMRETLAEVGKQLDRQADTLEAVKATLKDFEFYMRGKK